MNRAAKEKAPSKRRILWWGVACLIGLILAGAVCWWRNGGREQVILFLQADFRVTRIDRQSGTMTLTRPGETLIVSCAGVCDLFRAGKKYSMMNRGGVLECKARHRKIELPIIEQHVEFEKLPGGQG